MWWPRFDMGCGAIEEEEELITNILKFSVRKVGLHRKFGIKSTAYYAPHFVIYVAYLCILFCETQAKN
jgi:hypothetical protein